jgi:hypothetical protein
MIKPLGHIVLVGRGGGVFEYKHNSLPYGATMSTTFGGSKFELIELIDLAKKGLVKAHITKYKLDDIEEAYKTVIHVEALNNIPKKGQCGVKEAAVAFMFFTEEVLKKKLIKHKAYMKLSKKTGLHAIQNPNLLCQNIKSVSKEFNISYENIMKRVDEHLIVRNKEIKERKKHIAKNESTNKNCSQNDAVELYLKNQDFNKKFTLLRDKWKRREDTASNARLYNSARIKSIRKRKKEVGVVISDLSYDFQEEVKVHITDNGMYDKACKNYKKLEATYMKKLLNLRDIYNQFDNKKRETNEKNNI